MASLIREGTGIGQGREDGQVLELAMRSEPFPLKGQVCSRWPQCGPG